MKQEINISKQEVWAAATKFLEKSLDHEDIMTKMHAALKAAYSERMRLSLDKKINE
jgi:hypothetical protein